MKFIKIVGATLLVFILKSNIAAQEALPIERVISILTKGSEKVSESYIKATGLADKPYNKIRF
ncbi:hypothetical protein [Pedobacter metabolipauper]|uniref:Uncharacterized protein n=1 Tax=Pedobacter metabolipauper TaxID=425513 RepID=A0A4V3D143_9SPHI|nr:hypothetical protein [Pedobacter metabolipauper]TDQ09227.1 hypothetical protein ATK78_1381 [Pedobacter metabolipauper]